MSASGRRTKTSQKTKERSASDHGRWAGLFSRASASKALALVPKQKSKRDSEQETSPREKEEQRISEAVTVTRARPSAETARPPHGKRPSGSSTPKRARQDSARAQQPHSHVPHRVPAPREEDSNNRLLGLLLIFVMIGLLGVAWVENVREAKNHQASGPKYDQEAFKDRVQLHRLQTGLKLNRERIEAELINENTAPRIAPGAHRVRPDDMMAGLPLAGEAHHRPSGRDRPSTSVVDPDHPDARIMYGLQEERDAAEWERKAMKQYVDDFVANAAAQGYKVQVDKNYNVKVLQRPRPNAEGYEPTMRDPSSANVPGALE